jgi:sulfur-oxidizing protein SoxY
MGLATRSSVRGISRRRLLQASGAAAILLRLRPASATPEDLAAAIKRAFGERRIQRGRVKIDIPQIAENGNVVPVTIEVESPMTPDDYVKRIHLFSEHNPLPDIVEFELGPHNGKARVSTRIRLAKSQNVLAVATLNDDTLWSTQAIVEVTVSGCG